MNTREVIDLLTLMNALTPIGIGAVKSLATQLQGKTDTEIKAIGDAIDDAGIARADEEIAKLPSHN